MDRHFADVIASLHPSFERLLAMPPVTCHTLPKTMPRSGIYLFSEAGRHLYVGRTKNLKARLAGHTRPSATHNQATFGFRLAREATGRTVATYTPMGSRGDLVLDERFLAAFDAAKARIRSMEVRFIGEPDSIRQTILEVYVAVALQTPYNDFDTH